MTLIKGHNIRNTGRTHWKMGRTPWNKGTIGIRLKPLTGWNILCKVCGNEKYYQLNEHKKRKRKYCSQECYWKDENRKSKRYGAIHSWLIRKYGKAKKCSYCGSQTIIDWANISGKYHRDINDFIPLCRKHHIRYDKGLLII